MYDSDRVSVSVSVTISSIDFVCECDFDNSPVIVFDAATVGLSFVAVGDSVAVGFTLSVTVYNAVRVLV